MELTGADGRPVPLGTPRRRALLGYLVWRANQVVSIDAAIEALWGGVPPATAQAQIHSDISALRRTLLGSALVIHSRLRGYALEAGPADLDYLEFADVLDRARAGGDPADMAARLRAVLAMWRGEAFSDIRAPYVRGARIYMHEQKLLASELLAEAELALGHHFGLVPELSALVAEYPLRERLRAQLMIALHRSGRTADALASARDLRKLLADQQGLDPGSAIADLEQRLLRAERSLDFPVAAGTARLSQHPSGLVAAMASASPLPAELPVAPASFVGRAKELRQLDVLARESAKAMAVTVIAGSPGAGKTTMAVHWGHRRADRFPDGQLYVNLRGFDPVGVPAAPGEALRGFLLALGVAPQEIPAAVDEQAALYRSRMRGRRILVVLDNARDEQQVRPLLPGSAGAAVLVTSRRTLAGLAATAGARIVHLGQLSKAEAKELLVRRVGKRRAVAEPQAVEALVESCARLPLALCVAASRAVARPNLALQSLADDLRAPAGGLDALASDDIAVDVRTVFAASYRGLSAAAARLFRTLSRHAGPDIGRSAAAALAGLSPAAVDTALGELVDTNLVTEAEPHRYASHDLLRAYAAERAHDEDPVDERMAAQRRVIDYYVRTAEVAASVLNPHRIQLTRPQEAELSPQATQAPPQAEMSAQAELSAQAESSPQATQAPPEAELSPQAEPSLAEAEAWFAAERHNLQATVVQAAVAGLDEQVWQLALAVSAYLDLFGHWHDWIDVGRLAVEASVRLGDGRREGHAHHSLAVACNKLGLEADTDAHINQAIRAFAAVGDTIGQAHALSAWSRITLRRGQHEVALDYGTRALELFIEADDLAGQATAHNSLSGSLMDLGRTELAWTHASEALRLFHTLGDARSEADAWDSVGCVHHQRGEYADALRCFGQAHALWRQVNDRLGEAVALRRMGDTLHALGDPDASLRWAEALRVMEELHHHGAQALRALLDERGQGLI